MGEHDALGVAGAAAGKDDRGDVGDSVAAQAEDDVIENDAGNQEGSQVRQQPLGLGYGWADVVEVDEFHAGSRIEGDPGGEPAGGDGGTAAALVQSRQGAF